MAGAIGRNEEDMDERRQDARVRIQRVPMTLSCDWLVKARV